MKQFKLMLMLASALFIGSCASNNQKTEESKGENSSVELNVACAQNCKCLDCQCKDCQNGKECTSCKEVCASNCKCVNCQCKDCQNGKECTQNCKEVCASNCKCVNCQCKDCQNGKECTQNCNDNKCNTKSHHHSRNNCRTSHCNK